MWFTVPAILLAVLVPPRSCASSNPPRYYIVVQLTAPSPPVSGQFKLVSPINSSRPWDCQSGLTPITYPGGSDLIVRAQSIDMHVGGGVECLGLSVSVVERLRVQRWQGEEGDCAAPLTVTTRLERSEAGSTEYFQLAPAAPFRVFASEPSGACAAQQVEEIAPPGLRFGGNSTEYCAVVSEHLSLITCNLTITTDTGGEVVAIAVGATSVPVPRFLASISLLSVTCTCTCAIRGTETPRTTSLSLPLNTTQPIPVETAPVPVPSYQPSRQQRIILGTLSGFLSLFVVLSLYLLARNRALRRSLGRHTGLRSRVTGLKKHQYGRVRHFTNECHHYNTLSLRLSDCKESCNKSQTFPVYQKLNYNEHETL